MVVGSRSLAWAGLAVASFGLYRLSVFTHEISHFRPGQLTSFTVAWNVLAGIPCLLPSFLYDDHRSHHVNHSYGTSDDAEYYPLAHGPIWAVVTYFAQVFILPIGAVVRFLILTPLSAVWPRSARLSGSGSRGWW